VEKRNEIQKRSKTQKRSEIQKRDRHTDGKNLDIVYEQRENKTQQTKKK